MTAAAKSALTATLNEQAAWRQRKADEYPDDERNLRCATHLRELAAWVDNLRDDDDRLAALSEIPGADGAIDFGRYGEEADRRISRFGFDRPVGSDRFGDFLDELIDVARREHLSELADVVAPAELLPWVQRDDPDSSLPAIGALREWIADVEEEAVLNARVEGMPWGRIGELLGRSKQAVWERYRDVDPREAADT